MINMNRFFFSIFDQLHNLYLNSNFYDKKILKVYNKDLIYKPSPHLLSSLIKYQKKKIKIDNFSINEICFNFTYLKKIIFYYYYNFR